MTAANVVPALTLCDAPVPASTLHCDESTAVTVQLAQTVLHTHPVTVAVPAPIRVALTVTAAEPVPSAVVVPLLNVTPEPAVHTTGTPAAATASCVALSEIVHVADAPAAR